jgi:4-amino-4-deoxy-L-arabinose transferase-like glycosyltransferase
VPAWSWLVSIGPIALWIALATALAPDGFARGAVATNVFGRFFAGTSHARPFYYYAYQLPLDFLPWSLLGLVAVPAIVRACRAPRSDDGGRRAGARFLAAWSLTPLAFFTLSAGKRGLYLLPIFPALALASTFALPFESSAGGTTERARSRIRLLAGAIGVVAIGELAGALIALPRLDPEKSPRPIAESIARHAAPLEIVGIYRLRPLEGAIPYYGDRQVASLPSEEAALAFFASGGRLILLRADDFERRREGLNLESLARFRSARRELVLAQRAPLAAETEAPPSKAPAP